MISKASGIIICISAAFQNDIYLSPESPSIGVSLAFLNLPDF